MKISYNWLKEYVDIKVDPQKLADDLSLFGHEVEDMQKKSKDWILDIKFTANRGDCLSILGIAREIAALYNKKFQIKNLKLKISKSQLNKKLKVNICDSSICSRFSVRIIDNIKIKESPAWMKAKLVTYGFRPINNIVDITNLVMIETGQPLHAFDYDKIYQGIMNIRTAKTNEYVITLDGKEQKLDENAIVIDDGKRIFDLAGIMGGLNSEIDKKTKTIVLEAAVFDPVLIRRTSKRLNHITDASYRFERGIDIKGNIYALNYATHLINQTCQKSINSKLVDIKTSKIKEKHINAPYQKINNILGTKLTQKEIEKILSRLNINYKAEIATIPSYRSFDIKIWQDIAEEVARVYGYNKIATHKLELKIGKTDIQFIKKEYIKDLLVSLGFNEIYSYSFVDEKLLELSEVKTSDCREVINSITPENKYLRPSLESSLLIAISKNPWVPEINIFEIGKVFTQNAEFWELGIAVTAKNTFLLKEAYKLLKISPEIKTPQKNIVDYLKIRKQVKYFTIKLDCVYVSTKSYNDIFPKISYKKVSEFPPTIRDLAFIVNTEVDPDHIKDEILKISNQIFIVELFDEFASDQFGLGKKNVAYHIWMQNLLGTMTQKNTDIICKKIIKKINNKFKARLR